MTKETIDEKMKNLFIVDDAKAKQRTPEEINNISFQIVKDIKKMVESIILNAIQKVKKDLHYKNYIFLEKEKLFSLSMFSGPYLFNEEL